jgi:hypothetical protein
MTVLHLFRLIRISLRLLEAVSDPWTALEASQNRRRFSDRLMTATHFGAAPEGLDATP